MIGYLNCSVQLWLEYNFECNFNFAKEASNLSFVSGLMKYLILLDFNRIAKFIESYFLPENAVFYFNTNEKFHFIALCELFFYYIRNCFSIDFILSGGRYFNKLNKPNQNESSYACISQNSIFIYFYCQSHNKYNLLDDSK